MTVEVEVEVTAEVVAAVVVDVAAVVIEFRRFGSE